MPPSPSATTRSPPRPRPDDPQSRRRDGTAIHAATPRARARRTPAQPPMGCRRGRIAFRRPTARRRGHESQRARAPADASPTALEAPGPRLNALARLKLRSCALLGLARDAGGSVALPRANSDRARAEREEQGAGGRRRGRFRMRRSGRAEGGTAEGRDLFRTPRERRVLLEAISRPALGLGRPIFGFGRVLRDDAAQPSRRAGRRPAARTVPYRGPGTKSDDDARAITGRSRGWGRG